MPNRWNAEVVRALSSRLPGGKTTPLTIRCEDCGSEFYPCLCAARDTRTPHVRSLRSPRIVELAEQEDKHAKGGNLGIVRESSSNHGMDHSRLIVFDEADGAGGEAGKCWKGKVSHRKRDEYTVFPDDSQLLTQRLELEEHELNELLPCLDDVLSIHHRSCFIMEIAVVYDSKDDAEGDVEIRNVRGGLVVHSLAPNGRAYSAGVRACHALVSLQATEHLTRLPKGCSGYGADAGTGWGALDPVAWLPKEFRASQPQQTMSMGPHGQPVRNSNKKLDGLDWPCRLIFNALPSGWRAVREVVGGGLLVQLKRDSLHNIAREGRGATLEFECMPAMPVGRGTGSARHGSARHEHVWEGQICAGPENDAQMLECWLMNSRLTPAQLGFVLKSLLDALRCELSTFEEHRADLDAMLRAKIRRTLDIENTLSRREGPPVMAVKVVSFFEKELSSTRSELVQIMKKVPVYYLKELCYTGVTFPHYRLVPTKIRDVSVFSDADRKTVHVSGIKFCHSGVEVISFEKPAISRMVVEDGARAVLAISFEKPTMVNSYMLRTASDDALRDPVRWRFEGSHDGFDESVCLLHNFVHDASVPSERDAFTKEFPLMRSHAEAPAPAWEPGSLKGRARSLNVFQGAVSQQISRNRPPAAEDGAAAITDDQVALELAKAAQDTLNPRLLDRKARALHALEEKAREGSDGQLSFKEFERVIYNSGITWLKATEVQSMFNSIDVNKNGKLNLGEILGAAARLADLVRRCYTHCDESFRITSEAATASLEATTLPQLMEQFSEKVLLGEDLVAAIPDSRITASSHSPGAGGQADMGMSRIDRVGAAWVADGQAQDASPWISWDLGGAMLVTAVLTRGCPEPESWVTKYHLDYVAPCKGNEWVTYGPAPGVTCELGGNSDCDSLEQWRLDPPFEATQVRLRPLKFFPDSGGSGPAMRASLLGFPLGADGRRLSRTAVPEAPRAAYWPLPTESNSTVSALPTFT